MPRVSGFPIRIAADEQFTASERESLSAVVREWNEEGQKLIHSDLFTLNFQTLPVSLRQLDPHACSDDLGGDRDFAMVRELNNDHWSKIGFEGNTPAATVRCYEDDFVSRQIIYLNPSLITLTPLLDQAFSHELGHSLGLDHSCQADGGSDSFLSCTSLKKLPAHPYHQAVMYPWLKPLTASARSRSQRAGDGNRVAAVIEENDETRTNCIIGEP